MAQSQGAKSPNLAAGQTDGNQPPSRTIAVIGPYLSGKTTLLEAILARTGAITRQGAVNNGSTVGDASAEARAHAMSVTSNIANTTYLGDAFTFIDCPGSVEFQYDSEIALSICDAAIVVCEPDPKRVPALQMILKQIEDRGIPHFLFLNKIDACTTPVRDIVPMLQPASERPLVLRQIAIWQNGVATGFIDLASERAYLYREHAPSEIIALPYAVKDREQEARFHMLEQLADYDDELMEQLLSDILPPNDKVFDDLANDLREGVICPVLIGSAQNANGIERLMKALRHEAPYVGAAAERLGFGSDTAGDAATAIIVKSIHSTHGGKLSLARVLSGEIADGAHLRTADGVEARVSGVFALHGDEARKRGPARAGDTVALGRLDAIPAAVAVATGRNPPPLVALPPPPEPVFGTGLVLNDRKDEVKLTTALHRLVEEDPALRFDHDAETNQIVLLGQGEMHLRVALERLQRKYGLTVGRQAQQIPYQESIRKPVEVRGRHKKQSGGHGQFGDVLVDIEPQPRGTGFVFEETITGGAIPRQFIPSVEIGVKDYLQSGPLGFPVVDIKVTLKDGSFHSVDSSDMAFRQAGRLAMSEGMPNCQPVLLEPIQKVEIAVPSDATARVNGMISQRRGQILGFDARPGWPGWDLIEAYLPQAELGDLIVELRSATAGVGTFTARFDHLSELVGRQADQVLSETGHAQAAE